MKFKLNTTQLETAFNSCSERKLLIDNFTRGNFPVGNFKGGNCPGNDCTGAIEGSKNSGCNCPGGNFMFEIVRESVIQANCH